MPERIKTNLAGLFLVSLHLQNPLTEPRNVTQTEHPYGNPRRIVHVANGDQSLDTTFRPIIAPSIELQTTIEDRRIATKYGIPVDKVVFLRGKIKETADSYGLPPLPVEYFICISAIESKWTYRDIEHPVNKNGTRDYGPFGINSRFIIGKGSKKDDQITEKGARNFYTAAGFATKRIYDETVNRGVDTSTTDAWIDGITSAYNTNPAYLKLLRKYMREGKQKR